MDDKWEEKFEKCWPKSGQRYSPSLKEAFQAGYAVREEEVSELENKIDFLHNELVKSQPYYYKED